MRKILFLVLSLCFAVGLGAQTLTLTAVSPPTIEVQPGRTTDTRVDGTFTLGITGLAAGATYYTWTEFLENDPGASTYVKWTSGGTTVTVPYSVYSVTGTTLTAIFPIGNRGNVNQGYRYNFTVNNSSVTLPYCVIIPLSSTVPASPPTAIYTAPITVRTFGNKNQNAIPNSYSVLVPISFTYKVLSSANLAITSGGTDVMGKKLALGDVTTTARSSPITVGVTANFTYTLKVTSQNGGNLVNPLALPTETLSYTMAMTGVTNPMVAGTAYSIATSQPATTGTNFTGTVNVPAAVSAYTAGEYTDVLTFTISAE